MNRLQVPRHRRLLLSSNVLFLASLLGCGSDAGHPSVVPSPSASPTAAPIPSPSGSIIYFVPTPIESSVAKLPTCAGSAREMSLCPNRHASVQSNHRPVPRAWYRQGATEARRVLLATTAIHEQRPGSKPDRPHFRYPLIDGVLRGRTGTGRATCTCTGRLTAGGSQRKAGGDA